MTGAIGFPSVSHEHTASLWLVIAKPKVFCAVSLWFFIKNKAAVSAFEGPDKDELKELSKNLDKSLKQNELLLKTRMEAEQKVMDTFIHIAKVTNNSNATSYGAHGTYTPLDNNRNALAFNRTL